MAGGNICGGEETDGQAVNDRMTPTMGDIAHGELQMLSRKLARQIAELQMLAKQLAEEQAELRDELHTLANRHGWSVKA